MRRVSALAALCLCALAAAMAPVQITVHDPLYKVAARREAAAPRVDYALGAIFVTTQARAPGRLPGAGSRDAVRKAALTAAREQLRPALLRLQLTGYATLGDVVASGLIPAALVDKTLANLRPVVESWDRAASLLTLTCALPMTGPSSPSEFAARMLDIEQKALTLEQGPRTHPLDQIRLLPSSPAAQVSSGPYTGVILDCTGMHVTPLLLPKLVRKDGVEVWGTAGVSSQLVLEKGVAGVATSLRAAVAGDRAGAAPFIIRPLGTAGPLRGDLVLRDQDSELLKSLDAATRALSTLSVVLVID